MIKKSITFLLTCILSQYTYAEPLYFSSGHKLAINTNPTSTTYETIEWNRPSGKEFGYKLSGISEKPDFSIMLSGTPNDPSKLQQTQFEYPHIEGNYAGTVLSFRWLPLYQENQTISLYIDTTGSPSTQPINISTTLSFYTYNYQNRIELSQQKNVHEFTFTPQALSYDFLVSPQEAVNNIRLFTDSEVPFRGLSQVG